MDHELKTLKSLWSPVSPPQSSSEISPIVPSRVRFVDKAILSSFWLKSLVCAQVDRCKDRCGNRAWPIIQDVSKAVDDVGTDRPHEHLMDIQSPLLKTVLYHWAFAPSVSGSMCVVLFDLCTCLHPNIGLFTQLRAWNHFQKGNQPCFPGITRLSPDVLFCL